MISFSLKIIGNCHSARYSIPTSVYIAAAPAVAAAPAAIYKWIKGK